VAEKFHFSILRIEVTRASRSLSQIAELLGTFHVRHNRGEMYSSQGLLSVCPSSHSHYCMDPDVTRGNGRVCPLVVRYWADLQSVHGFRCYDNIASNAKCQRVLVLALCLVSFLCFAHFCFGSIQ